jgi:nitric oxide reductase subunit B
MTAAPPATPAQSDRRNLMVGKGWIQAVVLVVIFGFFVMGILAYRTYTASMPQPDRVVTGSGEELFTGQTLRPDSSCF